MDDTERRLLRESLATTVASAGPGGLRTAVTSFGWHDLLADDPALAVSVLAELQGEHLTEVTMLDDVVLAAAGISGTGQVVYPNPPHDEPDSQAAGSMLTICGVVAGDPVASAPLIVPARRGESIVIVTCGQALRGTSPPGMDPRSGWRQVRLEAGLDGAAVQDGEGASASWQAMRAAGQRALAHELVAVGRRMLASAVRHVSTREQFGQKIGGFQAVKHMLADVRVWQECAELAAAAAWEDGQPESARLAKILAGRFARAAAANCQQVLGGMGFTWEHGFHQYLRRALVLEPLLGSAVQLRSGLGADLHAGNHPRLALL